MTSFLTNIIGNPFSTPVGQLIEKATDSSEVAENWAMYMEICDLINSSEDGPRDAIKAFKKQLSNNAGKNHAVILYTLKVLETCVKNCGHRFHAYIAQRDFLQELIKLLTLKVLPPQVVVDRILSLLQTWADAFQGSEELKEVERVCKELKEKGFEFPVEDFENAPPIHTPARKVNPAAPVEVKQDAVLPPDHTAASKGFYIDSAQLAKLKSELDVVLQNCKIFNELLSENTPGKETQADWKLMKDLNDTGRECHKRLVDLVGKYYIENLTCDILPVNDEVTNIMLRFERYERLRNSFLQQQQITKDGQKNDDLACISAESGAIQAGNIVNQDEISKLFPSPSHQAPSAEKVVTTFNPFAASPPQTPNQTSWPKEVEMEKVTSGFSKSSTISTNPYTNQELLIDVSENDKKEGSQHMTSASSHEFNQFLASKTASTPAQTSNTSGVKNDDDLFGL